MHCTICWPLKSGNFFALSYLLLLLAFPVCTSGQTHSLPGEENVGKPIYLNPEIKSEIDKVDPRNGNLTVSHTDLLIPGDGGLDIKILRNYNLSKTSAGLLLSWRPSFEWTALGTGWELRHAPRIYMPNVIRRFHDSIGPGVHYNSNPIKDMCNGLVITDSKSKIWLELMSGEKHQLFYAANGAYTKNNWMVKCDDQMKITATSPRGVKYHYDYADRWFGVYQDISPIADLIHNQTYTVLSANRMTDPFGNWVDYKYRTLGDLPEPWDLPRVTRETLRYIYAGRIVIGDFLPAKVLDRITSSDGRKVNLVYDDDTGRLQSITDGAGNLRRYIYQNPGQYQGRSLVEVVLPTGDSWRYEYYKGEIKYGLGNFSYSPLNESTVSARRLKKIKYPTGGEVYYSYTYQNLEKIWWGEAYRVAGARVKKRNTSDGGVWVYNYSRGGEGGYDTTEVEGPDGKVVYKYYGAGYAIKDSGSTQDPGYENNAWRIGLIKEKEYPNGDRDYYTWGKRVVMNINYSVRDLGVVRDEKVWAPIITKKVYYRSGKEFATSYRNHDSLGNPKHIVELGPNGSRQKAYRYEIDGRNWIINIRSVSTNSGVTEYRYNRGKVREINDDGVVSEIGYDDSGNVEYFKDSEGNLTYYKNYKLGVPRIEEQPEGVLIEREVDEVGNVISYTSGRGNSTNYQYDGLGRLVKVDYPLGLPKTIKYKNNSIEIKKGAYKKETFYDGFGRSKIIKILDSQYSFNYDVVGRLIYESGPDNVFGTSYSYDAMGRISMIRNPNGSVKEIRHYGDEVHIFNEKNNKVVYSYRAYGDPAERELVSINAPGTTSDLYITRNDDGLVTSIEQNGLVRIYGYNSKEQLVSVRHPETGVVYYRRDSLGNVLSSSRGAGIPTSYSYDGRQRLISIDYPDGTIKNIDYDDDDNITKVEVPGVGVFLDYDKNGRVVKETQNISGESMSMLYGYNQNGYLSTVVYPISGDVVNYSPDGLGRPTEVSGYVQDVGYWPSGQIKYIDYANGVFLEYGQDERLWPNKYKVSGDDGSLKADRSYSYDVTGNLTAITNGIDPSYSTYKEYDDLNRITMSRNDHYNESYGFDGNGNINFKSVGADVRYYDYTNNQLSSVSGDFSVSYDYDEMGNVSQRATDSYAYDFESRMVCYNCEKASGAVSYYYDGFGRLVKKGSAKGDVYFFNSLDGRVLAEKNMDGTSLEYLYLGVLPVAIKEVTQ